MPSQQIRYQSWASIVLGMLLFALMIGINASQGPGYSNGLADTLVCMAFIGIGVLGLTTARGVRELEHRLARLDPPQPGS